MAALKRPHAESLINLLALAIVPLAGGLVGQGVWAWAYLFLAYYVFFLAPGRALVGILSRSRRSAAVDLPLYFLAGLGVALAAAAPSFLFKLSFQAFTYTFFAAAAALFIAFALTGERTAPLMEDKSDAVAILLMIVFGCVLFYLEVQQGASYDTIEDLIMIRKNMDAARLGVVDYYLAGFHYWKTYAYSPMHLVLATVMKTTRLDPLAYVKVCALFGPVFLAAFYRFSKQLTRNGPRSAFIVFIVLLNYVFLTNMIAVRTRYAQAASFVCLLVALEYLVLYATTGGRRLWAAGTAASVFTGILYMGSYALYGIGGFAFCVVRALASRDPKVVWRCFQVFLASLLLFGLYFLLFRESYATQYQWVLDVKPYAWVEIHINKYLALLKPLYVFRFKTGNQLGPYYLGALACSLLFLRRMRSPFAACVLAAMWIGPVLVFTPFIYPLLKLFILPTKVAKIIPSQIWLFTPVVVGYWLWEAFSALGRRLPCSMPLLRKGAGLAACLVLVVLFAEFHGWDNLKLQKRTYLSEPPKAFAKIREMAMPRDVVLSPTYKINAFANVDTPLVSSKKEAAAMLSPETDLDAALDMMRKYKVRYILQINPELTGYRSMDWISGFFGLDRELVFPTRRFDALPELFPVVYKDPEWILYKVKTNADTGSPPQPGD